jgi:hypothetical protein
MTTTAESKMKNRSRAGTLRDKRFVTAHRGGPLEPVHHRLLAIWGADCAERVLALFEEQSGDRRPRAAIETARKWSRGEVKVGAAQKAAVAAHAAAREIKSKPAIAAARAAGHAVATAHMADHSLGASLYALKAVAAAGGAVSDERRWQLDHLPGEIRELVVSAIERRRAIGLGSF